MGVIMHVGNSYTGSAVTPNPQSSATGQLEKVGIDGTIYEVGNKVTEGYYYDGKFYEYPVVVGLFLDNDTAFVIKMIPYTTATPAVNTLYYATDDSKWYMWDGSKYNEVTSGTGEIEGKKDQVYFELNAKSCYMYDGTAFQGIVDGTTVYDRIYSISDHAISWISSSDVISVPTWVGKIETVMQSAISDHKNWINGIVGPSNIHDRTYQIVDHEIIASETLPCSIDIATWVGRIDAILQSAISDHATWIDNLPEPMVFKGTVGAQADNPTVTALPVDGTATVGDTYKVITVGTYASKAAKVGDTFICLTKTSSANTWELIPSGDEPSGTVTNVAAGDGLITASGSAITTSGTIKTNLRSFTKLTNDSAAATETSGRIYPVSLDKSGYLSVNVPWEENDHEVYQERIKYNDSGANDNYYLLFSKSANFTSKTEYTRKNSDLSYVPSESQLYVPNIYSSSSINSPYGILNINSINRTVQTGSGTAGSESSGTYYPAKWTLNVSSLADRAPIDGDTITIKIPVAGYSKGEYLSVDDGTTYYPVAKYGTARLNTEYDVGSIITLIFDSSASITAYAITGSSSSSTVTGGAWRVVNYYDTNTNTAVNISNTNPSSGTTYYPTWHTSTSGTSVGLKANDGLSYETLQGTASAAGYGCLNIGNATSTGTAGNKYGVLRLYGQKNAFATLRATQTSTTNRNITLPDKDGTIALTSDLSSYLPLAGGTLTGVLNAQANIYTDSYTGAINMQNSNIYGLNAIYTADAAEGAGEGINFYRDATHVDTLWMAGGDILFVPNRVLGTNTTAANSQKVGRFTANPTSGQVVITDGTTGGMKSSGYTIATSVPSGAVFTDTKVTQAAVTTSNTDYPVILGYSSSTSSVTNTVNKSSKLKFNPSTGMLKIGTGSKYCNLYYNATYDSLDFSFS